MGPKGIKPEDQIRKLSKIEANKVCVDCPEKMPAYVNLTHRTYVCTKCSGIHRNLQFKIKGISMTQFTDDDVKLMESGGNGPHNALYMARYVPGKDMPIPNGNDTNRMKEFIKLKYDKKWYSADGVSNADFGSSNVSSSNGGGRTSFTLPSSNQTQSRKSIGGGNAGMDLLDMMDSAPATSVFSPSNQQSSSFNAFSSSNSSSSSQGFDAFGSAPAVGGGNQSAFGTFTPENNNSFDAFGASSQPTQSFDNFGQQMNFQQPQQPQQPQNVAFGQPQGFMNQGQPMGGFNSNFGQPAAPMVFIKTAPPAPAPIDPVAAAVPPKPVIPGFSAFDDLVIEAPAPAPAPVPALNASNPFDMVNASGPQHNPFGVGPPAGYPPQQQYGMPPQQQFGIPPQQYGMPPQQVPYGMPPQQFGMPGMPPNQYGYPQQQMYGAPQQQQYGMPPGAPFQNPGMYPPNMGAGPGQPQQQPGAALAPAVAPAVAPAAPDPFSSMAGLAFETVNKAPPPRSSITPPPAEIAISAPSAIPNHPAPAPVVSANPFDMF